MQFYILHPGNQSNLTSFITIYQNYLAALSLNWSKLSIIFSREFHHWEYRISAPRETGGAQSRWNNRWHCSVAEMQYLIVHNTISYRGGEFLCTVHDVRNELWKRPTVRIDKPNAISSFKNKQAYELVISLLDSSVKLRKSWPNYYTQTRKFNFQNFKVSLVGSTLLIS